LGTAWSQSGTIPSPGGGQNFGTDALISPDGMRVAVTSTGATTMYVANGGGSWVTEAFPGTLSNVSLAWSGDSARLAGGRTTSGPSGANGAVDVFLRSPGTGWALEQTIMGGAGDNLGLGVALDATGATLVASGGGCPTPTCGSATIYAPLVFYSRSGSVWTNTTTIRDVNAGYSGGPVAIAGDASVAVASFFNGANYAYAFSYRASGSAWAAQPGASLAPGSQLVATSTGDRVAVAVDSSSGGSAVIEHYGLGVGGTCAQASDCGSPICVNNRCCNGACAGPCAACAAALTGQSDGICSPLSATQAAGTMCRAATGPCGTNTACSSTSMMCPSEVLTSGNTCGSAAGTCAPQPTCNGVTSACPATSAVLPVGTVCGPAPMACEVQATCDGTHPSCPANTFVAAGTTCGPVINADCETQGTCNGTAAACQHNYLPATHMCAAAGAGACDQNHFCTGSSSACPMAYLSGNVCRPATGACDVQGICSGTSPNCPPDTVLGAGVVCRASTDPSCDPAEHCDGTSSMCPTDVTTCVMHPDTGVMIDAAIGDGGPHDAGRAASDGSAIEAGSGADTGGTAPPSASGCACRAGGQGSAAWLLALLALVLVRRRA
jgi:MYXO-CTERM domain-containing protein